MALRATGETDVRRDREKKELAVIYDAAGGSSICSTSPNVEKKMFICMCELLPYRVACSVGVALT